MDISVLRRVRLALGGGYGTSNGSELTGLRDRQLSGAEGTIALTFGSS